MSRSAFLSSLPILVTGNSATISSRSGHLNLATPVTGPVALEYGDLTARIAAPGQQRGQQAAGAAAEDRYPHSNSYMCQIIDERCFYDTQ